MKSFFRFKNWEVFLILILIPLIIHINLPFLFENNPLPFILTAIFVFAWIGLFSMWFYKISDTFKTPFLESFEIKLYYSNLIGINIIYIVFAPIVLLLFYRVIPSLENYLDFLSKISLVLKYYIYAAMITNVIIASRIIAANKLQRKLTLNDYYKTVIAFLFFPIGIFWIQKQLNEISTNEEIEINKKRSLILIGVTFLLIIGTILNLKDKNLTVQFSKDTNTDILSDSSFIKMAQQQNDSLFNSMNDSSKADYILKASLQLYQMGNFRSAINNLNIAIKLDSLNADCYYNRGVILYQKFNQIDSAITDMTYAVKINSNYWEAYFNRGYYNSLLKQNEIALQDMNEVVKLNPDFSNTYLLRGDLKKALGDNYGACKDWMEADRLGNKEANAKIMASDCFSSGKQKK